MGLTSAVVLGPVKLLTWTADQVREAAEAELYDEHALRGRLAQLNADLDAGAITEAEFLSAEDDLMERLDVARARGRR